MAAQYPAAVKSFVTRNAGDVLQPSHVNDLQDEVNAIEAGLLQGSAPLNSSNSTLASLSVTGNSTLAGSSLTIVTSSVSIGGVPYLFPSVAPTSTGLALIVTSTGTPNTLSWASPVVNAITKLNSTLTELVVSNSSAETDVFTYLISSGTLVAGKALRLTMTGSFLNATAVNQSLFSAVKLGGTVIGGSTSVAMDGGGGFAASVNRHSFYLQAIINANNASNSQRSFTTALIGSVQASEPAWVAFDTQSNATSSGLAIDMAAAQTLAISVRFATANSSLVFRRFAAYLELIG